MSSIQHRTPLSHEDEFKYAKLAMEWYGWGPPSALASCSSRWPPRRYWCASPSTASELEHDAAHLPAPSLAPATVECQTATTLLR